MISKKPAILTPFLRKESSFTHTIYYLPVSHISHICLIKILVLLMESKKLLTIQHFPTDKKIINFDYLKINYIGIVICQIVKL